MIDSVAFLAIFIMSFLAIVSLNAFGFKISCELFGKNVSFFEAIVLLIIATIIEIVCTLAIYIPGMFVLTMTSMSNYYLFLKLISSIVGCILFFKYLKNHLNVSWLDIVVIYIIGNVITLIIVAGIVMLIYLLAMWFGINHIAEHTLSNHVAQNTVSEMLFNYNISNLSNQAI
jgi:hypothetical protein